MEKGNIEGLLLCQAPRHLSDHALLARVQELVRCDRQTTAELVAHLAEVDARQLYLEQACSSLFNYATQRLGMSEPAAYKRITVARLARRLPVVLDRLATGRLHLSGLTTLAPHLTEENASELIEAACGRTLREVEKLVAVRFPKASVPDSVRKLAKTREPMPESTKTAVASEAQRSGPGVVASRPEGAEPAAAPSQCEGPESAVASQPERANLTAVASQPRLPLAAAVASEPEGAEHPLLPRVTSAAAARDARAECAPLDADRYKIAFTASASLKEKLEAARALVSHTLPDATLADIVERALDVLLERERARRFAVRQRRGPKELEAPQGEGTPSGQRRTPTRRAESPSSDSESNGEAQRGRAAGADGNGEAQRGRAAGADGNGEARRGRAAGADGNGEARRVPRYIEAGVRRKLVERDGERCTWTDEHGRRCSETHFLQVDHIEPHCLGGQRDLSNLRLLCAAHNALEARRRLGPVWRAREARPRSPGGLPGT
jgi:hypothetical protein